MEGHLLKIDILSPASGDSLEIIAWQKEKNSCYILKTVQAHDEISLWQLQEILGGAGHWFTPFFTR